MCLNGVVSISTFPWNPVVDALILGEKKCKGFVRGYYPLLFDTLPEMPFWKDIVPFLAEPVENVCSNPLRLALNESDLKRKSKGFGEKLTSSFICYLSIVFLGRVTLGRASSRASQSVSWSLIPQGTPLRSPLSSVSVRVIRCWDSNRKTLGGKDNLTWE